MRPSLLPLLAWLVLGCPEARAGVTFSIEPFHPTSSDQVRIRIDLLGTCDPTTGSASVDLDAHVISVAISTADTCNPSNPAHTATPRYIPIGQLPPGVYTVQYDACFFPPLPEPPCSVFRTESLVVYGVSATPHSVPTLSWLGVVAVVVGVFCGMLWTRKRSGFPW
jgi:hypothetical protein